MAALAMHIATRVLVYWHTHHDGIGRPARGGEPAGARKGRCAHRILRGCGAAVRLPLLLFVGTQGPDICPQPIDGLHLVASLPPERCILQQHSFQMRQQGQEHGSVSDCPFFLSLAALGGPPVVDSSLPFRLVMGQGFPEFLNRVAKEKTRHWACGQKIPPANVVGLVFQVTSQDFEWHQ